jgi:thymidine kinase
MSLTLFIGPMFSGKSSLLLSNMKKYTIIKKKVLAINHSFDKRYSTSGDITTHDGQKSSDINKDGLVYFLSLQAFSDLIIEDKFDEIKEDYSAVFIDEGQFFPDIYDMTEFFLKRGKNLYISFLNSDYKREPFKSVERLYAIADKIVHTTAVCCLCGKDAPFTKRVVNSLEQVLVGSEESYQPRCRECF